MPPSPRGLGFAMKTCFPGPSPVETPGRQRSLALLNALFTADLRPVAPPAFPPRAAGFAFFRLLSSSEES